MALHEHLKDADGYLARMNASLREKARIVNYIGPEVKDILDVGCADGAITRVLADVLHLCHQRGHRISDEIRFTRQGQVSCTCRIVGLA